MSRGAVGGAPAAGSRDDRLRSVAGLPAHHVPRPRLTERCRDETVVVLEASAGYGKSVLAVELVDRWGLVPVLVVLEQTGVSAQLLASRLRAAVAQAGFVNAAGAATAAGDDPAGAVDAILGALAGEPCAIVIDDAHHAERDAAQLLDRMATRIAAPQRLVVAARLLPQGAERLRRADALQLGAADLALQPEETLELCRSGFGLEVTADDARTLDVATGGWTAAAVLAASRAKRTTEPLRAVARFDPTATEPRDAVGSILEEVIGALGAERSVLSRIAPLPLLDRDLLATVTGVEGFFERAVQLGLPLTPSEGGWWRLPGPVRDYLAQVGGPDRDSLVLAAGYYEQRGELGTALQMLLAAGESEAAVRLLAEADLRRTEGLDALELLAVIARIPDAVLDRHPRASFQVARACGIVALLQPRANLLDRLDDTVRESDDPALRRAIDAELATDVLNGANPVDALPMGHRVLASATADEPLTRARALTVMGQATCFVRDEDGVLSEAALAEAAGYLDQAMEIYVAMGYGEAVSGPAVERAIRTELGTGRPQAALEVLDAALVHVTRSPARRSRLLFYRAQVLTELGRQDEAQATLDEALRTGGRQADKLLLALVHWERMTLGSLRGDAGATLDHANQVEANRDDWWAAAGAYFLAEAADCLDRVGHTALAWKVLGRAEADPQSPERMVAMSECALLARHGDPVLAEQHLAVVHRHGIYPRERWRVILLRAYAAWRRGDAAAGGLAAMAFEEAARLGHAQAPLIRERELTESLLALATATGSPAAAALEASPLPLTLAMLGRFDLTRGGQPVIVGSGQSAQLLKMVAVAGGRLPAERAIEALWPDVDPTAGRNRLRTVLGRLKEAAPEAIRREGETLALGPDVAVDLQRFHQEARQALALAAGDPSAAVAVARSAIARYRGELLPDDPYDPWSEAPRHAARQTMLDLLDLCAVSAARRGQLDEARRLVERTIELAPLEEDRYLRVAEILDEQGRRGAALAVLNRARKVLAALDIDVHLELPRTGRTVA